MNIDPQSNIASLKDQFTFNNIQERQLKCSKSVLNQQKIASLSSKSSENTTNSVYCELDSVLSNILNESNNKQKSETKIIEDENIDFENDAIQKAKQDVEVAISKMPFEQEANLTSQVNKAVENLLSAREAVISGSNSIRSEIVATQTAIRTGTDIINQPETAVAAQANPTDLVFQLIGQ